MSKTGWYTTREFVSKQYKFIQCGDHLSDSIWYTTFKVVVCQNNNRSSRISNVERNVTIKTVVIYNDGIKWLVKELRRELSFKIIVSDIEIAKCRQFNYDCRETSDETIITHIKLVKEYQSRETLWDDTTKSIGIDVKESYVCEQPKLHW